ncbi:diaminopimelate decarboxylase [Helicovermis profundi]|uniref:Diaminopimelate decarboxylase n=1 Tax=Helicovermis profundi TaxID=3065157 RepID=A0AAU9ESG8_9FIRM|nr:diaminopimelate decarboxylase [Clostridia bacterium S502]
MNLHGTMSINEMGNLEIGNIDTVNLAKKYGTPLYVFDVKNIKNNINNFKVGFKHPKIETEIIYASKAFLTIGMCKLIEEQGLSLDVVSGGELYTAKKANFPPNKIYFHGNNKTIEELILALNYGVNKIIIDNEYEIELVNYLCTELDQNVEVLLRVNPGIEAHTHEYIQTANNDSKFGISIFNENICDIISSITDSYHMTLKGFHYHIGSQILDEVSFIKGIEVMMNFVKKIKLTCSYETKELNLGGGFGVYYSKEDSELDLNSCLKNMLSEVNKISKENNITIPKLLIEPGRSIVANSGTTLYKVGATKDTFGGKSFIFVDGGMADNPRTALYDAIYEGAIANKMTNENTNEYTIAGKCCESGDIVIKTITLPKADKNDILAVASTGAYNYSMASNYNRLRKPAVVFVENGKSKVVVKRETYDDIIRNDTL